MATNIINFISKLEISSLNTIAILVDDRLSINSSDLAIDQKLRGAITTTLKDCKNFSGKYGEIERINVINENMKMINVLMVGIGDENALTEPKIEAIGGKIFSAFSQLMSEKSAIEVSAREGNIENNIVASSIASGIELANYRFDNYHTKLSDKEKFVPSEINICCSAPEDALKIFEDYKKPLCQGNHLARDLVTSPSNKMNPEFYAQTILSELEPLDGVDITVLGEREMKELSMGALLGVGQGSHYESKLVIIEYSGAEDENQKPVAFVGKGVTFDTGGISLKPANNMWDMKYDMAGSAAVVGAIKAAALRKAKVNIVGVVALVENMPSGGAQRPGDVVKSMSGQTIEVLNTDAEGRLILADALTYVQEKFNPEYIVDLATLTGAILVALGTTYGGLFSNDDDLGKKLQEAGEKCAEPLWKMPLHEDFDKMIRSSIADVANIGIANNTGFGGAAGSSTAAHFLQRFINKDVKWAHLDIAGKAWSKPGTYISPKGATGYGVRLLNQFIKDNHEK